MTLWPLSQRGRCVTLSCSTLISVITKIFVVGDSCVDYVQLVILLDSLVNANSYFQDQWMNEASRCIASLAWMSAFYWLSRKQKPAGCDQWLADWNGCYSLSHGSGLSKQGFSLLGNWCSRAHRRGGTHFTGFAKLLQVSKNVCAGAIFIRKQFSNFTRNGLLR